MARWIACGETFIIGDVVRWTEPLWTERGRRKKKLVKIGSRRVTAEVKKEDRAHFVFLTVLKCEILDNLTVRALEPLPTGLLIRRKRFTIGRGSGERLKWSEEGARALAASKFLR